MNDSSHRPPKLLDCTLRDGGHVNEWNFGEITIREVIKGLSSAGIDIIELGLLRDLQHDLNLTVQPTISAFAELVSLSNTSSSQYFTVMIRPDWYQATKLEDYSVHSTIKGIRFAFYPGDAELAVKQAYIAKEKGYDIYLNAVGVSCYSDEKLISTLRMLSSLDPVGYSIVDTFGAFQQQDLEHYYEIFDHTLPLQAALGLHLHENRSLALSLAKKYLELRNPDRDMIIDASLYGMGRIPGNLCIEQIVAHLNGNNGASRYNLTPILQLIENCIYPIRKVFSWGYSPEYMLSALANVNRNYSEYLQKKGVPLHAYESILLQIRSRQGDDFQFNQSLVDDLLNSQTEFTS